jgi:metallo-beta-lactamase class B
MYSGEKHADDQNSNGAPAKRHHVGPDMRRRPVAVVSPGYAQQGNPAAAQAHIDAATTVAGTDLRGWLTLCRPVDPPPENGSTPANNPLVALIGENNAAEPMKVFDNLFFLGTKLVSAWAIRTSEGIILSDALNNDDEVERSIIGGLRKLGLDPAQIKYLLITHARGDHYGGANYLVEKYHPPVVMSETDWRELEKPVAI